MALTTLARQLGTTTKRAEEFLVELANLEPSEGATRRLSKRFREFLPDEISSRDGLAQIIALPQNKSEWDLANLQIIFFVWLQSAVHEVWESQSEAEWLLFLLRLRVTEIYNSGYFDYLDRERDESGEAIGKLRPLWPPHPDRQLPIDLVMEYFRRNHYRAKTCPNQDCLTPYFFAKKSRQVYCSDVCSAEAQREYKRRWWAEHGRQWRKGSKKK